MVGCSTKEEQPQPIANADEYYVKYVMQYTKENIHMDQATATFTFTDEHLKPVTKVYVGTGGKDEIICGPFKRGNKISASCDLQSTIPYSCSIEIHVSKNNSPFAFKGSGKSIEYTIDF